MSKEYLLSKIIVYLIRIPCILLALSVHEAAHGWMAYKMGDETARDFGRISLNPLKHLDPIGALCMILFGFGWASPVPVNSRNFKNPRKGMALTALAGPVSNLLLGFIGCLLTVLGCAFLPDNNLSSAILYFLFVFYSLNISLAVFNMIPIPPFDGSRVLFIFLPEKWYFGIMKYERYIMLALLVLLWTDILTIPISYAVNYIEYAFFWVIGLIPGL